MTKGKKLEQRYVNAPRERSLGEIEQSERIKMPKRGVNWDFLNFIARIKTY
jgi:hypothetical protein